MASPDELAQDSQPVRVVEIDTSYNSDYLDDVGTDVTLWLHDNGVRTQVEADSEYVSALYIASTDTYCSSTITPSDTLDPHCQLGSEVDALYPNSIIQLALHEPDELRMLVVQHSNGDNQVPFTDETRSWFGETDEALLSIHRSYDLQRTEFEEDIINLEEDLVAISDRISTLENVLEPTDSTQNSAAQEGEAVLDDLYTERMFMNDDLQALRDEIKVLDATVGLDHIQFSFNENTGYLRQYTFNNPEGTALYTVQIVRDELDGSIPRDSWFSEVEWKQELQNN